MRRFSATFSVSVLAAAGVTLCPTAAADTSCPYDMNTKAGQTALGEQITAYGQHSTDMIRATGHGDPQDAVALAKLNSECLQKPLPAIPGPEPKTFKEPQTNLAQDFAAVQAAANPPDLSVLPNGAPDCDYYNKQISAVPDGAKRGMDAVTLVETAAPKAAAKGTHIDPNDVVAACGISNALLSTASMLEGDNHDAQQELTQSQIGLCDAAKNGIPGVTLPLNCPGG